MKKMVVKSGNLMKGKKKKTFYKAQCVQSNNATV